MHTIWIYKFDGTIQCDPDSSEISLESMRADLAVRIGDDNILHMEKRSLPTIELCGAPTGSANAFEITSEGWVLLNHGITGNPGYRPWPGSPEISATEDVSGVHGLRVSIQSLPTSIKELIGRPLRVYTSGDSLTKDWIPERVNIEKDQTQTIVDIWFG